MPWRQIIRFIETIFFKESMILLLILLLFLLLLLLLEYVGEKVEKWDSHVIKLAESAVSGKLCGFYVRPTAPVDVFFKNTCRHR